MGANAHYPMSGAQAKKACVPDTVLDALELGRVQKKGKESGTNVVDQVRSILGGKTLIRGTVRSEKGVDEGGFYLTELLVDGTNQWKGHEARLILKNETMVIWVDGQLRCVFPDYIFMLDATNGAAIQTEDIKAGMEIEFVGAPCDRRLSETLNTDIGKAAFTPKRYGMTDLDYVPYAELNK